MAKKRTFRSTPNILVTGTPGTGKTTFAGMLADASGFRLINVGDWVKEQNLHTGWDEEHQSFTLDEDKVGGFMRYPGCMLCQQLPPAVRRLQTLLTCPSQAWKTSTDVSRGHFHIRCAAALVQVHEVRLC